MGLNNMGLGFGSGQLAQHPEVLEELTFDLQKTRHLEQAELKKQLKAARTEADSHRAASDALAQSLTEMPADQVPQAFWERAQRLDQEKRSAEALVRQLEDELASHQDIELNLAGLHQVFDHMPTHFQVLNAQEKQDFVQALLARMVLTAEHAELHIRDQFSLDKSRNGPDGEFHGTVSWLPKSRPDGTPVLIDRYQLMRPLSTRKAKKKPLKKRQSAAAIQAQVPAALARVEAWKRELEAGKTNRASIARRENLTRARVTQLMYLTHLPGEMRQAVVSGQVRLSLKQLIAMSQRRAAKGGVSCG